MPEQVWMHLPHWIHLSLSTSKCVFSSIPIFFTYFPFEIHFRPRYGSSIHIGIFFDFIYSTLHGSDASLQPLWTPKARDETIPGFFLFLFTILL
jgi:hypothetical protein